MEKPKGFFEVEYLRNLGSFFREIGKDFYENVHMMSSSESLSLLAHTLSRCNVDIQKMKILDMGAGYGYVMAALELHGIEAYGIETDARCIDRLEQAWELLDIKRPPQIIQGDYFDSDFFAREFPDGTKVRDMGLFYCYTYSPEHARKILLGTLAGQGRAKIDSLVALSHIYESDTQLVNWSGYEKLNGRRYSDKMVLRKVAER